MLYTLCYYVKRSGETINSGLTRTWEDKHDVAYLHSMVKSNSDLIFFFTIPTTDIW